MLASLILGKVLAVVIGGGCCFCEAVLRIPVGQQAERYFVCRVTSDLVKRVWQHKKGGLNGFTKRYRIHTLVWYEVCDSMTAAIAREKAIKEWKRAWKIKLIEEANPKWRDLYEALL